MATRQPMSQIEAILEGIRRGQYPWWFPPQAKGLAVDYFVYGTDFTPLALSATVVNVINIAGDSAFMIMEGVLVETFTDNTTFMAQSPLMARLGDSGSNRSFSNIPIHASNWFGTASEPKRWTVPKLLAPNSTFTVELANLEAVDRNIKVAFHGFKLFAYPG